MISNMFEIARGMAGRVALFHLRCGAARHVQSGPAVADGNTDVTTTETFGPEVILVGNSQSLLFVVDAGLRYRRNGR